MPDFAGVGSAWTDERDVVFINHFVDQPMLQGASRVLKILHERSQRSPDELAPLRNLLVISALLAASWCDVVLSRRIKASQSPPAEPPRPRDGDSVFTRRRLMAAA